SMRLALANAGRSIDDVDYISAYGPGDPTLDAAEVAVIKQLFGARAYEIPVTSIKGVTGNPLSASGPLQVAACALAIRDRRFPPLIVSDLHLAGEFLLWIKHRYTFYRRVLYSRSQRDRCDHFRAC